MQFLPLICGRIGEFMKHPKKIKIFAAVVAVALSLGATVLAATYDSSEDPLISLSYLTYIFKPEIQKDYEKHLAALEARVEALEGGTYEAPETDAPETDDPVIDTRPETDVPEVDPAPSAVYEVIELSAGDALYAVSPCDIMLRAGTATCIAPDASQGIADYTDAIEIYDGQALTKNHMCLIPRGDGRGILATSDSVYIMVRGDYTIVEG